MTEQPGIDLLELEGYELASRFRLHRLLGQGGYGAVFEAEQLSMGRRCAVKVLAPQMGAQKNTVERFHREARTTSRLTHPNTIVIYDFGEDEQVGLLFLAMEYLEGTDVYRRIRDHGPIPVAEAVEITRQVCESLDEAHQVGLIHRDIKPHNIMLTKRSGVENFVKVIDFGIAKALFSGSANRSTMVGLTQTGTIVGTPHFMSPEQIGDLEIDGRSDQYSVAICLYAMLTGRPPFSGTSPIDVASKHLTQIPPPLREIAPGLVVNDEFEQVLLKALSKKREERYESVMDFANALEAALQVSTPHAGASHSHLAQETWEGQTTEPTVSDVEEREEKTAPIAPSPPASLPDAKASAAPSPDEPVVSVPNSAAPQGSDAAFSPEEVAQSMRHSDTPGHTLVLQEPQPQTAAIPSPRAFDRSASVDEIQKTESIVVEGHKEEGSFSRRPMVALVLAAGFFALLIVGLVIFYAVFLMPRMVESAREPIPDAPDPVIQASDQEPRSDPRLSVSPDVEEEPKAPVTEDQGLDRKQEPVAKDSPAGDVIVPEEAGSEDVADAKDVVEEEVAPGVVRVTLIPWGELYVNNRRRGDAPSQRLRLPPGKHRFELRQGGQVRATRTVDVTSGSNTIIELVAQ